jgi:4-amino-4-deoxychorismate lyase
MCQFIETIHLNNGVLKHLDYHQNRLNKTLGHFFPGEAEIDLMALYENSSLPEEGRFRCTVRYGKSIESVSLVKYKPRKISALRVVSVKAIDYSWKYSDRKVFQELKKGVSEDEDIIIIRDDYVTDSSYANLLFYDGLRWYTPMYPLLAGTKRQKLLDEGIIFERNLKLADLKKFRTCSLINAMLDPGEVEVDIVKIIS